MCSSIPWVGSWPHRLGCRQMTREKARQASQLLKTIENHESLEGKIRRLHKEATAGDSDALDQLATLTLELNDNVIRHVNEELKRL